MFLTFALFDALDANGKVESFLVFPTDGAAVVVDRLRDVRGVTSDKQVDLGALRFYADEAGLKIRRLVSHYGSPVFQCFGDSIRLDIEHTALPIADGTMGYYALLLPQDFYGRVHTSLKASHHWFTDTRRLLVSGEILNHQGYLTKEVQVHGELRRGVDPDPDVPRIKSTEVYADWSSGPHHNNVRSFIRAANASLSDAAVGVFVCHSSVDKPFARKLAIALAGAGFKVWIDEAEIRVGDSLIAKIESGVTGATHLVAVISSASLSSRWCQEELRMALARQIGGKNITVLPVVVDDCEPPGFLQEKKYADFRNFRQFEESVKELSAALAP